MTGSSGSLRATIVEVATVPVFLRAIVLASSALAILTTALPSWDVVDGYLWVAALAGVVATTVPDSGGWLFFAAAIVVAWVTGADDAVVGPSLVATALALLVGHVGAALAAAMPATAAAPIGLVAHWWRPTAVIALSVVSTAVGIRLLAAWERPGSIVIVIAALGVATLAVWRWSAVGGREPSP